MENVHAERSAGWSVLCYVAVLLLATLLNSGMPSTHIRASDVALALDSHRFSLLLGAWLTFPAMAFFLWFLVGLRSYLSHAREGRQEGLPTFALIAGVVMMACAIFAAALATAAIYASPDTFKDNALAGIYDTFVFMQGGLGYAPVSVFLLAAAHSMRRHESAPSWLSSFGLSRGGGRRHCNVLDLLPGRIHGAGSDGPWVFRRVTGGDLAGGNRHHSDPSQ